MVFGWRVHESARAFFADVLAERREPEYKAWRERYRIASQRAAWIESAMQKLGPVNFWKNEQAQADILINQEEQLGVELNRKSSFWVLFPRALRQLRDSVVLLGSQEQNLDHFFSVQWQLLAGNSYLFSSERYISGYALAKKMVRGSLTTNYLGVLLIFLIPLLVASGLLRSVFSEIPAHVLGLGGFAFTFLFLLLFRLLPRTADLQSTDALYNLLWRAPAERLEE